MSYESTYHMVGLMNREGCLHSRLGTQLGIVQSLLNVVDTSCFVLKTILFDLKLRDLY
jgi:hypothetical protein